MPTAQDLLTNKGFSVYSVHPDATVLEAVERMNRLKVGAVLVMDNGRMQGIFTERDILRRVVGQNLDPAVTKVSAVMTSKVMQCRPGTDVDEISAIMKEKRIRHIPVCDEGGDVLGLVSIGDINAIHATAQAATLTYFNEYFYGRV